MEECCAVCAEPLEWIAFGVCGHREVCSTCTARMRAILNDKQCCICKQVSPYIFVTKALGDYTRSIGDFSLLPQLVENGKEKLWYEANVEGYFDDEEEFKRIKATCKLYCTVCEQASLSEDVPTGFVKKGYTFKTLDLLRRHLFGVHKLLMCSLCLEGRKVFICEQKLYTKAQLERHSSDGNSKVDGSEEERGGFGGHPLCAFCKKRFYGDNELYQHMSIEHYTCHLCQRLRPGQFEYYRNYDDLEIHFRHEHVLCEHPDCLAKKFIVFPSESEFKRHNATSHGGNMSRAQRNAALQIPVSFQFRRSGQAAHEDQGSQYHRGRRGRFRDLDAIPSSAEMETGTDVANLEEALRQSSFFHTSLGADSNSSMLSTEGPSDTFPALVNEGPGPMNPVNLNMETSRYLAAAQGVGPSLQDSAFPQLFPPLPGKSKSARHRAKQRNQSAALSMAALLGGGRGGGIRVLNTARLKQSRSSDVPEPSINTNELAGHSVSDVATVSREQEESRVSLGIQSDARGHSICAVLDPPPGENLTVPSRSTKDKVSMSSLDQEAANHVHGKLNMDEIKAANKALVEQIKASLNGDEQQFADFKNVSSLFRKGEMGSGEFYKHIVRLGLPHVVPELARLCPDPQKQEELLKVHLSRTTSNKTLNDESWPSIASTSSSYSGKMKTEGSSKGKGMLQDEEVSVSSTEKKARESIDASDEVVETLHTDGYRIVKGKSKAADGSAVLKAVPNGGEKSLQVLVKAIPKGNSASYSRSLDSDPHDTWTCGVCTLVNPSLQMDCAACGSVVPHSIPQKNIVEDENIRRKKKPSKISKFQRVRLGEGSAAGVDLREQNSWISGGSSESSNTNTDTGGNKSFGRGVWKKQGGQHILSLAQRDSIIDEAYGSRQ